MTISEFYKFLLCGGSVECYSPKQRNELTEFIQDEFGIQIGPGTRDYMTRYPDGTDYMVVELHDMSDGVVVSFCANALGRVVPFEKVSHLMSLANTNLDNRTNEEFWEAFAELMS